MMMNLHLSSWYFLSSALARHCSSELRAHISMYAVVLAWMVIPTTSGNQWTLGGNTDNVRIIYNSVTSLLADVCLSVDLYYYSKIFGEGLRGFWPSGKIWGQFYYFHSTVYSDHSTPFAPDASNLQSWYTKKTAEYIKEEKSWYKKNKLVALFLLKFLASASLTISDDERDILHSIQSKDIIFEDWCRRKRVEGNKSYVMSPSLLSPTRHSAEQGFVPFCFSFLTS